MKNRQILPILIYGVLVALVPVFLDGLTEYSVFTIAFARFFCSSIVTFFLAFFASVRLSRSYNNYGTNHNSVKVVLEQIGRYLRSPNRKFYNRPQWIYLMILGVVGLSFQILFFFFSVRLVGISITYSAIPATIVIIAIMNWLNEREEMDLFKISYLILLGIVIFIIIYEKTQGSESIAIGGMGVLSIIIYTLSRVVRYVITNEDEVADWEIKLMNETNNQFKIIRLLLKSAVSQIFAAFSVFLISGLFILTSEESVTHIESINFYRDLPFLTEVIFSSSGLSLIFITTVIPFIIWFTAGAFWPRDALSFDQWASILAVVIPITGISLGVFLLDEVFSLFSLFIVILLMVVSIILRYLHETTNTVHVYLMIRVKKPHINQFMTIMLKRTGIIQIDSIMGYFDVMVVAQLPNARKYRQLILWIKDTGLVNEMRELIVEGTYK